jgi:hypothetical protein
MPGKKNIIADLLSRVAERSSYRHDLPVQEEDDSHHAAIQLRGGKVLLDKPVLKKRQTKQPTIVANQPSEASNSASFNFN